jgi:hypothetical protein
VPSHLAQLPLPSQNGHGVASCVDSSGPVPGFPSKLFSLHAWVGSHAGRSSRRTNVRSGTPEDHLPVPFQPGLFLARVIARLVNPRTTAPYAQPNDEGLRGKVRNLVRSYLRLASRCRSASVASHLTIYARSHSWRSSSPKMLRAAWSTCPSCAVVR